MHDYCWYWGAAVHWRKHGFQHVLWHSEAEFDALPSETVFRHNSHPKHTAEMTTALLLKVMVMEWPSMYPDLNPIEHMWGILKRKVEKPHVSNIQQLRDVIMEEWKRMPATTCAALVNSIPRRKLLRIGGIPSGVRGKVVRHKNSKNKKLNMSYILGKLRFLWFEWCNHSKIQSTQQVQSVSFSDHQQLNKHQQNWRNSHMKPPDSPLIHNIFVSPKTDYSLSLSNHVDG